MNKPELCLFTSVYPYGKGEPFIENELNIHSNHFSVIYLFHTFKKDDVREVPQNVKLIYIDPPDKKSKAKYLFQNILLILKLSLTEALYSRQRSLFMSDLRYNLTNIINSIYYSDKIKSSLDPKILSNAYFYSYWFSNWNFSLSILKTKKIINHNFTRAHGFDVFENNGKPNYLASRQFCLKNTDKVFTVSKMAKNYLKTMYPKYASKISCYYLGTKDYGINPMPLIHTPIHIVSCSSLVLVKRIHLIIELLKLSKEKIIWTHIGDGNLKDELVEASKLLPDNCIVNFLGNLKPIQVFNFYKTEPVDLFINCSISEGLPVSIMEAISYGIPIIATNVGGTGEIVTPETGFLIAEEVDLKYTVGLIENIRKNCSLKREEVKLFWQNNFNADINYPSFVNNEF